MSSGEQGETGEVKKRFGGSEDSTLPLQGPPGAIRSQFALNAIERFQNLVRHDTRFAGHLDFAPPLDKLIRGFKQSHARIQLDQEINRMIPIVWFYLRFAGISTGVTQGPKRYNLIDDYFELDRSKAFRILMEALEREIGYYRHRRSRGLFELLFPVHWIAFALRVPFRILELAGAPVPKTTMGGVYAWFLRGIMGILILFIATLFGVKVPWEKLLQSILGR